MPGRRKNGKGTQFQVSVTNDTHVDTLDQPPAYTTSIDSKMFASSRDHSNLFKDLRSSSIPFKRNKAQKRKYDNYSIVKPGQVSNPHYIAPENPPWRNWRVFPADLSTCEIVNLTKAQLYKEARDTTPHWMYSSRCSCCRDDKWERKVAERQERLARKEAFDWNKFGMRKDFDGQGSWDCKFYDELAWWDVEDFYDELWYCSCGSSGWAHGDCEIYGSYDDSEGPQTVYNLALLVDNAVAGLTMDIEEPEWEDLAANVMSSPEMNWADEVVDAPDEEDFEWI